MVLLLAQSSFYGYFSMKGKAARNLASHSPFSSIFDILKACINKPLLILKSLVCDTFHQVHKGIKN